MLPWHESEPSREITTASERLERRREGFDGQGRDRPDAGDGLQSLRIPALRGQVLDTLVQTLKGVGFPGDLSKQDSTQFPYQFGQFAVGLVKDLLKAPNNGRCRRPPSPPRTAPVQP